MKALRIACALLLVLNASCLKTVTMQTVIENDGSVERHIQIESFDAPKVDSDLKLPAPKGWQHHKLEDHEFEARGKFKSVADIPLDFEKTTEGTDETSKSVKTYKAFRCALFTIHEYTETITDITSADEFNKAVEKVIELRKVGDAIIEKAYGEEFDFTDARAYLEKEIVPRLRRLAAAYWDARANKKAEAERRLQRDGKKLLAELGMAVPKDPEQELSEQAVEEWLHSKLAELVKPKKGEPLTAEQVKERLEAAAGDEKLEAAAEEVIKERFGDEKKFEEYAVGIGHKLFGAYLQILAHRFEFEATVVVPGQIVETNGFIRGNEVSWSFDHEAIFPGYPMRVRSVAFARANAVGDGRSIITSPKNAVILADFVEKQSEENRARLLKALEDLARTHSAAALEQLTVGDDSIGGLAGVLEKIGLSE